MKRTEPERLFEENTKLAYSVLWHRFPQLGKDNDAKQEALLGLWKACITFDPNKSEFSTYATTCIVNQVRMMLRAASKQPPTVSISSPISDCDSLTLGDMIEEPIPSLSDGMIELKGFIKGLPQRDYDLIRYRVAGLSQKQISQKLGLSQPYLSRLLTKIYVQYDKRRGNDE